MEHVLCHPPGSEIFAKCVAAGSHYILGRLLQWWCHVQITKYIDAVWWRSYGRNDTFVVVASCRQDYSHIRCFQMTVLHTASTLCSLKRQHFCVSIGKTLHNADINKLLVADLLALLCLLTSKNKTFWTAVYCSFKILTCPCISTHKISNIQGHYFISSISFVTL